LFDERALRALVEEDDFICTDKYLAHTRNCGHCHYQKTDLFYKGGVWRGSNGTSIMNLHAEDKTTLILGHSDRTVSLSKQLLAKFMGFKNIYGVNLREIQNLSNVLPLGLTNNTLESQYHAVFSNTDVIRKVHGQVQSSTVFDNTFLLNFSTDTNERVRVPLLKFLLQNGFTQDSLDFSLSGRQTYLRRMRQSNFTICPVGNGADTHRLWEALYVGSTPIVKSNPIIDPLIRNLPVLTVKSWDELLNRQFLEESWHALRNRSHSIDQISGNYWESVFRNTHN
jgi:hypothetical protein